LRTVFIFNFCWFFWNLIGEKVFVFLFFLQRLVLT